MRGKYQDDPMPGLLGAVCKFGAGALFGCLISVLVLFVVLMAHAAEFFMSPWVHALWIIPVVWGVLSIFWCDRMLTLASRIFEEFIEDSSW